MRFQPRPRIQEMLLSKKNENVNIKILINRKERKLEEQLAVSTFFQVVFQYFSDNTISICVSSRLVALI